MCVCSYVQRPFSLTLRGMQVCIEALSSGEYMHIRNGIAILKELDGLVPLFAEQGVLLEKAVAALIAKETREDVKVLAVGYVLS